MPVKSIAGWLGAALCIVVWSPAGAQTYKCGPSRSPTYSDKPCVGRIVNTNEAPVPVKPNPNEVDVRRIEQNRLLAQSLRRLPGETTAEFDTRRRRTRMLETDRAECERLETRIPVEKARMNNTDPAEARGAEEALGQTQKRFSQMRC